MKIFLIRFGDLTKPLSVDSLRRFLPDISLHVEHLRKENFEIVYAYRTNFPPPIDILSELQSGRSLSYSISLEPSSCFIEQNGMSADFCCFTKKDETFFITNRAPLLYGVQGLNLSLTNNYISWMLYQGYVGSDETPFDNVKKLIPGLKIRVSRLSGCLKIQEERVSERFEQSLDVSDEQFFYKIQDYVNDVKHQITSSVTSQNKISFGISGGKDSRTCLALIGSDYEDYVSDLWTRGVSYSSDVAVGQLIAKQYSKISHKLHRPSYFSPEATQIHRVLTSVNNTQGFVSAYEFCGITDYQKSSRVLGRLVGLRGDRKSANGGDLLTVLNLAMSSNRLKYLRDDEFNRIQSIHLRYLQDCLGENIKTEFLSQFYDLYDTLVCRSSLSILIEKLSGNMLYPLLSEKLLRISLECPPQYSAAEFFHFVINHTTNPALNMIPFADQSWKQELLIVGNSAPKELRQAIHDASQIQPLRSSKYFPNLSNPLVANHKKNLISEFKPFLINWIMSTDMLSEIFNTNYILDEIHNPKDEIINVFRYGGLISASLLHTYGASLFDVSRKSDILKDISSNGVQFRETNDKEKIDSYELLLRRHEEAIANLHYGDLS